PFIRPIINRCPNTCKALLRTLNITGLEKYFSSARKHSQSSCVARARDHRQILLGTWLLARKHDDPSIARLIEEELARFLSESPDKAPERIFSHLLTLPSKSTR
ncbi:MAG: hypothetical protein OXC17_14825, partial [Aestuariivita sp.]|nr:hypothetical protein [Aestuariivita sp.]